MKPGVYLDIDRAQYDAIPCHNQSRLKRWLDLGDIPSEFKYAEDRRHEEKESDSLRLGRALDCWQMEHLQFERRFFLIPDDAPKKPTKAQLRAKKPSKETSEAIAYWEVMEESAKGKTSLSYTEGEKVARMSDSLKESDSARDVFANCQKAVLVANIFGLPCKGEIDLWDGGKTEHIWDLKALCDVSPKWFDKAFFDFGYDIQATFYLALARALEFDKEVFDFVCVKNSPPYTVKVHSFAPYDNAEHSIIAARASAKIGNAIFELDRRLKANNFKDDHDWRLIDIPGWRLRQAQMEAAA